jgi:hypothetical protein
MRVPLFLLLLTLASCRDQNVETALQVAYMAMLAAGFQVPYLTVQALDAWTPSDITVKHLVEYAKRYTDGSNGYFEAAQQRGVVVQVYDYSAFEGEGVKIAKHFLFVVFKVGMEMPQCDQSHRSRFYQLNRFVHSYWTTDHHRLGSEVLKQNVDKHSNPPRYYPSLASEFLGVPDSAGKTPDRPTRMAAVTCIGIIMSGYESFLEFPEAKAKDSSKRPRLLPGSSSSSSSSSSLSSSSSSSSSSSTTTTTSSGTAMEAATSAAAAAVDTFLASFRRLPGGEKDSALIELRDKLSKSERFDLRRVLEVNAPDELSADAVAAVSKQQWSLLANAMRGRATDMKRPNVVGAAGWVTTGATLTPVDFNIDVDFKRRIAPVPMAVIEGLIKSTNHHLDLGLQRGYLARVDMDGHVERDGRLFRLVGSEEREVPFNYHGRPHTLSWVRKEAADRDGALTARACYISDMLVASWNHGQEIITPTILRLSAAATQWLSEHNYDLLSSLGALLPRTTSVAVVDEMARLYDGAFVADTIRFVKATSSGRGKPCAASSQCDNYVAGQRVARHTKNKNNFREVATETRMFGFVRCNTLEDGDGGYGKDRFSCDMIRDMFREVKAELGLVCTGGDGDGGIWSLKLESLQGSDFKWAELFAMPGLPKDDHGPYRLRDHTLAPQVEACSADRQHFRIHLVEWAKGLFAGEWEDVHMFFVFDTEYIPHYISWIERSPELREVMKNTAVLPCKFHVRKHLAETLLARKPVLRNVFTEVLTTVLVTSKTKWELIKREADADDAVPPEALEAVAPEALEALLAVVTEAAGGGVLDDLDDDDDDDGDDDDNEGGGGGAAGGGGGGGAACAPPAAAEAAPSPP